VEEAYDSVIKRAGIADYMNFVNESEFFVPLEGVVCLFFSSATWQFY
jgi:hypothetical protein